VNLSVPYQPRAELKLQTALLARVKVSRLVPDTETSVKIAAGRPGSIGVQSGVMPSVERRNDTRAACDVNECGAGYQRVFSCSTSPRFPSPIAEVSAL